MTRRIALLKGYSHVVQACKFSECDAISHSQGTALLRKSGCTNEGAARAISDPTGWQTTVTPNAARPASFSETCCAVTVTTVGWVGLSKSATNRSSIAFGFIACLADSDHRPVQQLGEGGRVDCEVSQAGYEHTRPTPDAGGAFGAPGGFPSL
jgi:hypothetical protein